jgi:tRNA threonylcarbamoyladenosine biosynthesis protein TsaB
MPHHLNIHTTGRTAIVNLCDGPDIIATLSHSFPADHGTFLHVAIRKILQDNDIQPFGLQAVGVTGGPGSYTGIRVGLATAKGLCYALQIPLLVFNTLEVMAFSVIEEKGDREALYCPMIDARRMEVFTALYNHELQEVMKPAALIVTENSFVKIPRNTTVYFSGDGSQKYGEIVKNAPAFHFISTGISPASLGRFSWEKFQNSEFESVPGSHAIYIKDFYSPPGTK